VESIYAVLTVAAIAAVGIMSPGPDFLAVSYTSITGRKRNAVAVAVGVVLGNGIWAGAALLGVGTLFALFPSFFLVIKMCGAAYIAWLGIQLLRSARIPLPTGAGSDDSSSIRSSFAKGLSTTIANPKAALYYASALTSAAPHDASLMLLSLMVASVVAIAAIWFALVVLVLSTERAANAFRRFKIYFESLFGALLLAFGIRQLLTRS
jgi:threonine/homoserine/homoserine lactone efflux protein